MKLFQIIFLSSAYTCFLAPFSLHAQNISEYFEKNESQKIIDWYQQNPTKKVSVFNERASYFFRNRMPVKNFNCIPDSSSLMDLSIIYKNKMVYEFLLKQPAYNKNIGALSSALNMAIANNDLILIQTIEKLGAEFNTSSKYFFGQNSIQIALSSKADKKIIDMLLTKAQNKDYKHVDCIGQTSLHHFVTFEDLDLLKSVFPIVQDQLFIKSDLGFLPIEVALGAGKLEVVNYLWSEMKKSDELETVYNIPSLKKMQAIAIQSNSNKSYDWVENLINEYIKSISLSNIDFYSDSTSFDLSAYIDQCFMMSSYFDDFALYNQEPKTDRFQSLIDQYFSLMASEAKIDLNLQKQVKFSSSDIASVEFKYAIDFLTYPNLIKQINSKLNEEQVLALEELLIPLDFFKDNQMPKSSQTEFTIDNELIFGAQNEFLAQVDLYCTNFFIVKLSVKNVTNSSVDYQLIFPELKIVELNYSGALENELFVEPHFNKYEELIILGARKLRFPPSLSKNQLTQISVQKGTEIINLPSGLKVVYLN